LVYPFARFVLFIEMNNQGFSDDRPSMWVYGAEYGVRFTQTSGVSGTGETEFNGYTLTVTADETELAYAITDPDIVNAVRNKMTPVKDDYKHDWELASSTMPGLHFPHKNCYPAVV